jgi:hypothetical protein
LNTHIEIEERFDERRRENCGIEEGSKLLKREGFTIILYDFLSQSDYFEMLSKHYIGFSHGNMIRAITDEVWQKTRRIC